jgi:zinc protease
MKLLRLSLLAVFFAATGQAAPAREARIEPPSGITLVQTVERKRDDDLVIPYHKYRLDNGLTLILAQDQSDPIVHVDVTYHVGSAREEPGKSGFAHFFEHMMFQGSEHVADEEHIKIVTEAGGTMNGQTTTDDTDYFETVPSNQLEKMLWLEADRMGFLLPAVTEKKFEIQRATVKNERAQNLENRPYGMLSVRVDEALYPPGHPYSWPTIGYTADLDRVNVNDLKKFFLRWYGPNNATLTIGGRFDEAQALAWVKKYFGPIPHGPKVAMPAKPTVTLDADRYISMEDNVALPLLYMAWPTVHLYHPDEAPLDVLMSILGQGETSLLYKNIVKKQLGVQAGAGHNCQELACTFTIYTFANPAAGKTLADMEKIARDTLSEFEQRGVEDDDLTRVKMMIVSGKIYGLESVAGKVNRLATYQTFTGNPDMTAADIARYEKVTKADVMRVYRKYIKGHHAVIMSIVPKGRKDLIARQDNWTPPERNFPDLPETKPTEVALREPVDDFDRSVEPPAGPNPTLTVPRIWREKLDNGIPVLGALNSEVPTIALELRIEAGQRDEPLDKLGLAVVTAQMLNESTTKSTNEELSNRLQKLGSSVTFGAGDEESTMTIRSLTENLDETLDIAAEMLFSPKFDPDDFARVKSQVVQVIEHTKKDAAATANNVYELLLFGKDNSFAQPDLGTEATIGNITLDDVKQFYATHYSPRIASIVAVGDLSEKQLLPKLAVFGKWQGGDVKEAPLKPFPDLGKTKIYLIDKPGAAQSEIRIGKRSLKYDATGEFYRAGVMNFVLGGTFDSRINLNLREDKGYTYGARSSFDGNKDFGTFTASAGVRTDATSDSIVQFEDEIRKYAAHGITEDELAFTRRALGQSDAREFETPMQKLVFLAQIQEYDLDDNFVDVQNRILAQIGEKQIDQLASELLDADDMIILVVGDKEKILPGLQKLGYEIVELDADGNPV